MDVTFWIIVVFVYYMLATLLPVDKIIGKIYPLFAIALLFMAVGILVMLLWNHPALPEITDGLHNTHPAGLPIFPIMFVSIACGAISGFHATQSPLMARCMKNEKYGRPIFLWSDGDRRDRGIDLGCCRYLFFIKMVWRRVMLRLLWTA